jgi:hypothetical protein
MYAWDKAQNEETGWLEQIFFAFKQEKRDEREKRRTNREKEKIVKIWLKYTLFCF